LDLSSEAKEIAARENFDVAAYDFPAAAEQTRAARVVRTGVIQNAIVLPTSAPVADQRDALFARIGKMVDAAGKAGVQVLCLQECWSESLIFPPCT